MTRSRLRLLTLPLLAAALWVTGCSDGGRLLEPGGEVLGKSQTTTTGYRIAKGVWNGATDNSKEIGPKGGELSLAGHKVIVPRDAVSKPTKFFIYLDTEVAADGTRSLTVDLQAYQQDSTGDWKLDVGGNGFAKPVTLVLSYGWMSDTGDPATLKALYLVGGQTVLSATHDAAAKTYTTQLSHFSPYALGWP